MFSYDVIVGDGQLLMENSLKRRASGPPALTFTWVPEGRRPENWAGLLKLGRGLQESKLLKGMGLKTVLRPTTVLRHLACK